MGIFHLVKPKPQPFGDKLIARAARSWNPEFPGREENPRKYAKICWATMVLATSRHRCPKEMLSEICRTKGIDESEVFEALEALAYRIEETDYAFKGKPGMRATLSSRTKSFFERLR
jgi:hypothetical protein